MTASPADAGFGWPLIGQQAGGGHGADLTTAEFRVAVRHVFRSLAEVLADVASRDDARPTIEQAVQHWAEQHARHGGAMISPGTQAQLAQAVLDERFGLGPLQPYVDDPDVQNIDINGPSQVWLSMADGRRVRGNPVAASDGDLMEMVRTWGLRQGQTPREFSASRPLMNAALGTGVRLSAVMSVTRQVHVSVRCHRLVDITLEDLAGRKYQTLSPVLAQFLAALVGAHKNIIVTGGVDAGKTTLLRALAAAISPGERIATLESEYELYLDQLPEQHHDVVALEARQANSEGAGEITLHDLIPQALRLNPRRIIVGEVRDTEIRPMLEAMNSGHEGSMATIHANSAEEVFSRILMLAMRGHMAMAAEAIHLTVGLSRPFVAHIRKDPATGSRYVSEVIEVLPPADGLQPARNRVFVPGWDGRARPEHSLSLDAQSDLAAAGFNPDLLRDPDLLREWAI